MASNVCAGQAGPVAGSSREQKTVACVSHFRIDLILQFFWCSICLHSSSQFSNETEPSRGPYQRMRWQNCTYYYDVHKMHVARTQFTREWQEANGGKRIEFSRNNVMRNNRQSERVRRFKSIQITQYLLSDVLNQSTFRQY